MDIRHEKNMWRVALFDDGRKIDSRVGKLIDEIDTLCENAIN